MQVRAFHARRLLAWIVSIGACVLLCGWTSHRPVKPARKHHALHKAVSHAKHVHAKKAYAFQIGMASYYADAFQGRPTASGEAYDVNALTAAHLTLPLGTYVRVSNAAKTRSVVVRINDRGPYQKGRVIDLSFAAAVLLGLQHAGTAQVVIERVSAHDAVAMPVHHRAKRRRHKRHR
ncbi:septal ring lytic transglycosylase RlpA family protein [Caballeronia sp. GAFFF2]|uniref:septal ring lytic transglycosylase RlpA family protein n=1 Tax=Caballeronia sp. GAFFF2 TaxID=2921741 RepID=UPI002028B6C9|nr:septal ring lytic transglycosylase RlpA family protein [Caballeronia sp. GAFFF2]